MWTLEINAIGYRWKISLNVSVILDISQQLTVNWLDFFCCHSYINHDVVSDICLSDSSQMMTNLRNLCISLMKRVNPFSDDCFLKS